ncbi:hypothetical protein SIL08_01950 [Scandinavium sp. V105_16]|uniref:Uncharacterized protein n=1 Tax=Scandinavium lactucae TaxID=3095028 RepID=A0AAJ2VVK5_9ENTR|nr:MULTISPECIES: hypothetical protein [unclassified Scandinavium]MDX6019060.1 hypothetical protein [Scandinavium sp. V105_16]MDX6029978.1 hypothetical protein [Scandinavium sp. V105_12]
MVLHTYKINENLKLTLSKNALDHVLHGEVTDKVFETDNGRIAKKVISGGLHTYSGWQSYLSKVPGLKNVLFYNNNANDEWYYERELQNGTILLKLPESVFTSKAAKMTLFPENNYKSGFLWKTLFPKTVGESEILDLLNDALLNISKYESREGELICYYKIDEPLNCMRIAVLYRNGEINSFFPTWSQPNTGNNGKPFSFFDNIGHVISESSFVNESEIIDITDVGLFSKLSTLEEIQDVTPELFLARGAVTHDIQEWDDKRIDSINFFAENCSFAEILKLYNYVNDEGISKYHDMVSQNSYSHFLPNIKLSVGFFNAISFNQNIAEGIMALFLYDQKNKSKLYANTVLNLISNMFTSPFMDMWAKKRIHYIIASLTLGYHDRNFPAEYIDCLSTSPTRREFYSEYFYDSHNKKKHYKSIETYEEIADLFGLILTPPQYESVTYSHFLHYFSDNLGESYSTNYTDEERTGFLLKAYPGDYYEHYVQDSLKFFNQNVFTHSSFILEEYLELFAKEECAKPMKLHRVIYEYFKLQVAQRYRINLNYSEYHEIPEVVTLPIEKYDVYATILKHERNSNRFMTDTIIESVKKYLLTVEDTNLSKVLKDIERVDRKEIPRFPIPYHLIIKMVKSPESVDVNYLKALRVLEVDATI